MNKNTILIKIIIKLLNYYFSILNRLNIAHIKIKLFRLRQFGVRVNFVEQGTGGVTIAGNLNNFKIDETSHLKSNTFIECTGGVSIGKYFHPGRGLTIFSTNHNYNSQNYIPYDSKEIIAPVVIGDFIWCGSNVSIAPGSKVGDGVVIGMGTTVSGVIPPYAIICGNPCKIIGYRDSDTFEMLRKKEKYY
jgi:acetyltransferase-like isoleucine patch superfamily enzyme